MVPYNPCRCPGRLLRRPEHEFSQVLIVSENSYDATSGICMGVIIWLGGLILTIAIASKVRW